MNAACAVKTPRFHASAAWLALAALACPAGASPADWPEIPAGPGVPTEAQYAARKFQCLKRVFLDGYRRCGLRNADLDERCEKFLERCARATAGLRDAPAEGELAREGVALRLAGCEDPSVLYLLSTVLRQVGYRGESEQMTRRALDGLRQHKYPALLRAWAARRLWSLHDLPPEDVAKQGYLDEMIKAAGEMAVDGTFRPDEREVMIREMVVMLNNLPVVYSQRFYQTVRDAPKIDPLVVQVVGGCHCYNASVLARGPQWGWMHRNDKGDWTPTQQPPARVDWIGQARQHMEDAWKLDSSLPVVPCVLMRLAGDDQQERLWFGRTVAARLDYRAAYGDLKPSEYLALGGDRAKWQAMAEACLRTERFDTMVPSRYTDTLVALSHYDRLDFQPLKEPGVYGNARKVCRGYIGAEGATEAEKGHWRAMLMGFAIYAGQWADARQALDELARRPGDLEMALFDMTPRRAAGVTLAHSGADGPQIAQANALRRQDRPDEALAIFAAVLDKAADPDEAWYLRDVILRTRWARDFQAGKWVRLEAERGLPGWQVKKAWWLAGKDGTLVGRTREDYSGVIWCDMDLGPKVELKATVRFDPVVANEWRAGLVLGDSSSSAWVNVTLNTAGRVEIGPNYSRSKSQPVALRQDNVLLLRLDGPDLALTVNGTRVFEKERLRLDVLPGVEIIPARVRVGACMLSTLPGLSFLITDLQVRRAE